MYKNQILDYILINNWIKSRVEQNKKYKIIEVDNKQIKLHEETILQVFFQKDSNKNKSWQLNVEFNVNLIEL